MAIGQYSATEKMRIVKGERVEIFQRSVLKNTTRTLMILKRLSRATLLRLQEAVLVFAPFQKGARSVLLNLILGMDLQPLRKNAKVKIPFLLLEKRTAASGDFFAFDFRKLAQARFLLLPSESTPSRMRSIVCYTLLGS